MKLILDHSGGDVIDVDGLEPITSITPCQIIFLGINIHKSKYVCIYQYIIIHNIIRTRIYIMNPSCWFDKPGYRTRPAVAQSFSCFARSYTLESRARVIELV